jgi:hypothetical protein
MMHYCRLVVPGFAKALMIISAMIISACFLSACSPVPSQQTKAVRVTDGEASKPPKVNSNVNINEILPPGRGRDLLLNNCTSCHTFVPIVVLQLDKQAWEHNKAIHRSRVPSMTDADFNALYVYLEANFNPDKPVPKLPQDLLDTWTSY